MKKTLLLLFILFSSLILISCGPRYEYVEGKINITTTTNIMADLARTIGGNRVSVWSIMGAGVDPHGYREKGSDLGAFDKSDYILANGLHLEGMIVGVIDSYGRNKTAMQLGDAILAQGPAELTSLFIEDDNFPGNYDPHFWFNIDLYKEGARIFTASLTNDFPEHAEYFNQNLSNYLVELDALKIEIIESLEVLPMKYRFLISSHDAFEYFGREFGFQVEALQGKSTEDEITITRIKEIIEIVITNQIKAVFPETSVPSETISSVKDGVKEHKNGYTLVIGSDLYSDSLGDKEDDNTYIKMYRKNVESIIAGLTGY